MHQSNKYLFTLLLLLVAFLFTAHYLRYQQEVVLEQDGYQLIKVNQAQTILPHKEPIVFILETSSGEKKVYKFDGYENGDFGTFHYYHFQADSLPREDDFYFIEGFKNTLPIQKKLEDLSFEQRYDIVHAGINFEARQLIQHNLEPGILGYIDTMPLIFVFIGGFIFLLLKGLDLIGIILVRLFKKETLKILFQSTLIICLIFFLTMVRLVPWFPASQTSLLIRNAIVILPIFALLQWIKKHYLEKEAFWKNQLIIFVILFIGGNLLLWIGNQIGYWIDEKMFDKIILKPFFCTYDSLAIGFLMAFAIGLILNNLVNEIQNK